jgi:hypothetical protein
MKAALLAILPAAIALGGCSTFTTPRYSINADTNVALRALGATGIGVGTFSGPVAFDNTCRAAGPLAPPDGMTHTAYIRKALEDELKVAGAYAAGTPRVALSGIVNRLEFSSSRGLTGGSWDIDLTLRSSNGRTLTMAERYEFESGFDGITACKQTAEAYFPAVQNLIGKFARSPDFKGLLESGERSSAESGRERGAQSLSDWIDIDDPNELRALYSNKTFRGRNWDGTPFIGHYRADGRGVLIMGNQRIARTWHVNANEVCATDARTTSCYRYQRHRSNRNEIVARAVKDGRVVQFVVEDGVPNF